jgi:glutamate transport system permease protein
VNVITSHFGDFLSGFGVTLALTAIGFAGALVLGTVVCVCRVVPIRPLQVVGAVYVEFFRNIPLLSLLILVVFGLPDIGVSYSLFTSGAISLVLSAAPFVCEAIRGGINAVPTGQAEAARAIGLSFTRVLRHVVLPQAFRTMVQPLTNVFIGVALSSSLAAAVGVAELTNQTEQLTLKYADAVACFLTSGVFYVVLAFAGAGTGGWLDRRVAIKR